MDSTWYEVLVIILSVMLGIFLILNIILAAILIKIVKSVKRITDHAEHIADTAEHVGDFFRAAAPPIAILKIIANIGDAIQNKSKKKDK